MPVSQKPRHRRAPKGNLPPTRGQAADTFLPVYILLRDLLRGEVDSVQGKPIMRVWDVWDGEACEVCPALEGWISCWQRIIEGERLAIDLAPLRQVNRYLEHSVLLPPDLVQRAKLVTEECMAAYLRIPRARLQSYSRTEQIAVEIEERFPDLRLEICDRS